VGTGEVIAAWDQALQLMKKGSKLRILVPSQLGYGEQGSPPEIPRNARLIFDIELLEISN
jgi:FK506-binding protein 2